jgi:hypothetical protein
MHIRNNLNLDQYELSSSFHLNDINKWIMSILTGKSMEQTVEKKPKQLSTSSVIAFLVCMAFGAMIGYNSVELFKEEKLHTLLILALFIPLLAMHEGVHGIAYKICGAPVVQFGGSWKTMIVYAFADNHVITMRQLIFVAILPFVVITILLLWASFYFFDYQFSIFILLFIHSTACLGDFALIKYAIKHPDHVTYDEIEEKKMVYFYKPK